MLNPSVVFIDELTSTGYPSPALKRELTPQDLAAYPAIVYMDEPTEVRPFDLPLYCVCEQAQLRLDLMLPPLVQLCMSPAHTFLLL